MCLFILANNLDDRFPLVIAANRDEDHQRPTIPAQVWDENPDVVGGRDVLHGGSWLALHRRGRFAAVTNIRGATIRQRSRGFLVRDFVLGSDSAQDYIDSIDRHASEYAAFHLIIGEVGGPIIHYSNAGNTWRRLQPAEVHGVSNAPPGEDWEKVAIARDLVAGRLRKGGSDVEIAADLIGILAMTKAGAPIESQLFVRGDRYGTRASTAIVASPKGALFIEQNYGPNGVRQGEPRQFRL